MHLDFVIPGFSKCGTTSFCDALASHPDVFIPALKEPNFFAVNYSRGLDWYAESFELRDNEKLVGEGSTFYSTAQYALVSCRRILKHSPNCKFIFLARDPVARLESSFREMHSSCDKYNINPPYDFGDALKTLPNMLQDSRYWRLLCHYRSLLPDDRIHVVFLKDLRRDPTAELNRCFDFLGLEGLSTAHLQFSRLNPAEMKNTDSPMLRFIRTNPVTRILWQKIPLQTRNRAIKNLRLKKSFESPVQWSDQAIQAFAEIIAPDARQFLSYCGKPADFWQLDVRQRLVNRTLAA